GNSRSTPAFLRAAEKAAKASLPDFLPPDSSHNSCRRTFNWGRSRAFRTSMTSHLQWSWNASPGRRGPRTRPVPTWEADSLDRYTAPREANIAQKSQALGAHTRANPLPASVADCTTVNRD